MDPLLCAPIFGRMIRDLVYLTTARWKRLTHLGELMLMRFVSHRRITIMPCKTVWMTTPCSPIPRAQPVFRITILPIASAMHKLAQKYLTASPSHFNLAIAAFTLHTRRVRASRRSQGAHADRHGTRAHVPANSSFGACCLTENGRFKKSSRPFLLAVYFQINVRVTRPLSVPWHPASPGCWRT